MPWPPPLPLDNEHARSVVGVGLCFPTVATLCVIGRFVARRLKKAAIKADDWIILPALLAAYAQMVICISNVFYGGVGHHLQDLSADNLITFYKLDAAVEFAFGSSLGLTKISICLLLVRIFIGRSFRIAAWCVIVYCVCWTIMVIAIGAGLCRPFAYNWDKSIRGGKCGALDPAYISIAALDILGDVMIIALPMHSVWKLQVSRTAKAGLSAVFALGFLDILVAILRIVYLEKISFSPTADYTWDSTDAYVWSAVEPSLGIIVACSMLLRPLFGPLFSKVTWSGNSRSSGYSRRFGRKHEAYSDISNPGLPLRDLGGINTTTVDSIGSAQEERTERSTAKVATTSIRDQIPASDSIRVKNEFIVQSA